MTLLSLFRLQKLFYWQAIFSVLKLRVIQKKNQKIIFTISYLWKSKKKKGSGWYNYAKAAVDNAADSATHV